MSEPKAHETAPTTASGGWVPELPTGAGDHPHSDVIQSEVWDSEVRDSEGKSIQRDWAWVEEWRAGGEPTPWGPGIGLAVFAAAIVSIAIYVITAGLIDRPILAIIANVVIAGGLSPALYMARTLPVLRWVSLGGAAGALFAWVAVIFFPVIASA